MRKQTKTIIGICIVIVAVVLGLCCAYLFGAFHEDNSFNGSRVNNPDAYRLDFTYMNQKDEHTMHMQAGDTMRVTYEVGAGRIDVSIGIADQAPIYRGNDIQTGSFQLSILEEGDYTISVNASRASGKLEFTVEGQ